MKTLIICFSYHHKNTDKIASVFVKTLDAEVKIPSEVDPQGLSEYDLIGFGSGISFGITIRCCSTWSKRCLR